MAATKRELLTLAEHTQKFALNKELVALYDKVVPPVAEMEKISARVLGEVKVLTEVVANYDISLCTKANKQELLGVDNKFRQYVKKEKHRPFVEETENDIYNMKDSVSDLVVKLDTLIKNLSNDIHTAVRKAT